MTRTAVQAMSPGHRLAVDADRSTPRRSPHVAVYLFAIAIAATLRFAQLSQQIVADDEWRSLHALLHSSYGGVFTHFGACIPLTLYDKLVADTIGLSEWSMRAPMMCAGLLAVIVLPVLLIEWLGAKGSLVFQWLLAISPLHVHLSRYAEPYAIVFFLVALEAIACARWWKRGSVAWALVAATCAVAAPWFDLASLPFVIAPFAWMLWATTRSAREQSAARRSRVLMLLAPIVAGWCALIGPALVTDRSALAMRARLELPRFTDVYELSSGASLPWIAFASGVAFLLGLSTMLRRQRALLVAAAVVIGVEIALLAVIGPEHTDRALVLVCRAIPMLFAFLWIATVGLVRADELVHERWSFVPSHTVSVCLCAALLAFAPFVQSFHAPNNWTNHAMYQLDYSPKFERSYAANVLNIEAVSPAYKRIGEIADESFRVVEAPWSCEWESIPYPLYQRLYRRDTLIGFVDDPRETPGEGELPFGDPRFHFRNFVHVSDFDALRRANVRFVIFHRGAGFGANDARRSRAPAVERWRTEYIEHFGKPAADNAKLTVFDLQPPNVAR